MKRIVKSNGRKGVVRVPLEVSPTPSANSAKPVFSLSCLKITNPRTATDIQRAIAQGRVAELKAD
jgi:hypothetical protein